MGFVLFPGAPPDGGVFGLLREVRDGSAHGSGEEENAAVREAGQAREPGDKTTNNNNKKQQIKRLRTVGGDFQYSNSNMLHATFLVMGLCEVAPWTITVTYIIVLKLVRGPFNGRHKPA